MTTQFHLEPTPILNRLSTNILLLDSMLNVLYANAAAQQLFSLGKRRLFGARLSTICDHLSLDIDKMILNLEKHHQFIDNELRLVVHGHLHYLTLTAQQLEDNTILIELTELDQQHRLGQERLQYSHQAVTKELIRGLAHEIKNPLGGLRGAAQLLQRELPTDELKEYTTIIIEQADRLHNLVDRLLGPQRISAQMVHNIHQLLERVYKLLQLEKPDYIELIRDYDPSLPEFIFDAEQIEQVFLNIGRNALQALAGKQDGSILISSRTAFQVTINGKRHRICAKISITDNGPGIPEILRDNIFFPMVSGREKGSGLGLSIAQTIVEQHGGKIEVESWPGHTEFSVFLPIYY